MKNLFIFIMDYHQILLLLTTSDKDKPGDFDEKLEKILDEAYTFLPEELKNHIIKECEEAEDLSTRRKYLQTILLVLKTLHKDVLSISETFMSVTEYRGVKIAIEMIISLGIIPCLLPGIGAGLNKLCSHAGQLKAESISDLQKYNRLVITTRILTDCYNEISLRPAILTQLGPLLGALFQLAHAPLMKPTAIENPQSSKVHITQELYEKLLADQEEFNERLNKLIKNCPQSSIIKELMVLSGLQHAPNWLKRKTRLYVTDAVTEPTGIMSLINAMCEDSLDLGVHWNRLEVISKLVVNSSGKDPDKYYSSICDQLINILNSRKIKNSSTIANCFIVALYEVHPNICKEKIIDVISAPFMVRQLESKHQKGENSVLKSENEISESLENLIKCFACKDAKFKYLPCSLIKETAVPLFYMHVKIHKSPLLLKSKTRELLIHLLKDEELGENILSTFFEHNSNESEYFLKNYSFEFGPSGGVQMVSKPTKIDIEKYFTDLADSLLDLVQPDEILSLNLMNYLLKWLTSLNNTKSSPHKNNHLETNDDFMEIFCKQLAVKELLLNLVHTNSVQTGLFKSPQTFFTFIKSLFPENFETENDENYEILYTSLMLIKIIVTEKKEKPKDWKLFVDLSNFLKEKINGSQPPLPLLNLIKEVLDAIKLQGKSPQYQDLNIDNKSNEFDKALEDLADPLLPVRAHGLISLTKLIESSDPVTISKKDLALYFFKQNLKDEDSFIYLAAINGLCAMASSFPQQVIEILVQEFIDMPQRNVNGEIAPENRAKLGEILVKTTRALGDMAPAYKNILINGFLCAIRDKDEMVRTSSLSCLGELCKVLGFRLGNAIVEILYCIGKIIETDKAQECRRAAVLVTTLLIRGLGKDALTDLGNDLLPVYRSLKYLRDNDNDEVLRLHAQLALEELDEIVRNLLFVKPVLQKKIFLLS
ncbi:transport and Golgi organization protein 6 homolog [Chelonus insularis]|uniref:transport and Golgi organization protein 6 homolog n=1 Tax=Chelonus insularis TaxID=460826 RepID=UPI00158C56C2|nr:transport and Golgi organization protein 6 homolog [Chelonus insularis]